MTFLSTVRMRFTLRKSGHAVQQPASSALHLTKQFKEKSDPPQLLRQSADAAVGDMGFPSLPIGLCRCSTDTDPLAPYPSTDTQHVFTQMFVSLTRRSVHGRSVYRNS